MRRLEIEQMESFAGGLNQAEIITISCAGGGIFSLLLLLSPAAPVGVILGTSVTISCGFLALAIVGQDAYYKAHPSESHGLSAGTGDPEITTHHSLNGDDSKGTSDGAGTPKPARPRFD